MSRYLLELSTGHEITTKALLVLDNKYLYIFLHSSKFWSTTRVIEVFLSIHL